ncbi:hypothetical protein [Streptomyces sp. NPDC002845]
MVDRDLTSAPWHPLRPGDVVHVHYPASTALPAHDETYLISDAGDGLMSMNLFATTHPASDAEGAFVGDFAVERTTDPLYGAWAEAGPERLTIVRDGRVVHNGGAR